MIGLQVNLDPQVAKHQLTCWNNTQTWFFGSHTRFSSRAKLHLCYASLQVLQAGSPSTVRAVGTPEPGAPACQTHSEQSPNVRT